MNPEEIKKLLATRDLRSIILILFIFLFIQLFVEYFKAKGQNIATKQDIENITKKVEDVKAVIQNSQETEKQKRDLKYNALLKSLKLIDAYISNRWLPSKKLSIVKQYASVEEFRDCQNQMILTCHNDQLINLFYKLTLAPDNSSIGDELRLLNNYRTLVREELGFGKNSLNLDPNNVWFANVNSENPAKK